MYSPPRNGPTLWEIGIPDRSAAEFHVPAPYPTLMNNLYKNDKKDELAQPLNFQQLLMLVSINLHTLTQTKLFLL